MNWKDRAVETLAFAGMLFVLACLYYVAQVRP